MRTTLNIGDDIMTDLLKIIEAETKTEAVNRALTDYIRLKRLERLRSLRGKWPIDLDVEKLRELELDE